MFTVLVCQFFSPDRYVVDVSRLHYFCEIYPYVDGFSYICHDNSVLARCVNGVAVLFLLMRKIIHIDMDAFFAAVEQRDNPALRGLPLAIGHDGSRGVVATASYEARKYGVRSAMAITRAKQLCPELVIVPGRMGRYKEVSRCVRDIFLEYTDLVEPLSIDEAFLDVSGLPSAVSVAREIKGRIFKATGLTSSAGVSVNKFLAKIASDYQKPDGLTVVGERRIDEFVAGLGIERFYGVGRVTAEKMHSLGIFTGSDLRKCSLEFLVKNFGKAGGDYYNYARGVDLRPVTPHRERKSVGAETTFGRDVDTVEELKSRLDAVLDDLFGRLARTGFAGRTVTLKIRFADFSQLTRSLTMAGVAGEQDIRRMATELLYAAYPAGGSVRLIGVSVSSPPKVEDGGGLQLCLDL